jgi:hypothetical protein
MTVWLVVEPEAVYVKANAAFPGGGRGVLREVVRPGEAFFNLTYDALRQMGTGRHELSFPENCEKTPTIPGTGESDTSTV